MLLGCTHYAPAVDMWSVGCIFAELVRKVSKATHPIGISSGSEYTRTDLKLHYAIPAPNPTLTYLGGPQQALFPGDSELQQLLHIFKLLGTPDETTWPGVTALRDWHEFPQWRAQDLQKVFPTLAPEGVALMASMFIYDPAKRISVSDCFAPANSAETLSSCNAVNNQVAVQAKEAMRHPYFDDLDKEAVDLLESAIIRAREFR